MPLFSEHGARIRDPKLFMSIRELWDNDGIRALGGRLKSDPDGGTVVQSLRFDKEQYNVKKAKDWLESHEYSVVKFEAAVDDDDGMKNCLELKRSSMKKDVIRTGKFKHPKTGVEFEITEERMDNWIHAFHQMETNGVNVPLYNSHSPKAPLGHVAAMYREGDTLYVHKDFADEEAAALAKRARFSSISTNPDYVDCEGNHYGEVIDHVAITAEPVITGQSDYLMLSRIDEKPETEPRSFKMKDWLKGVLGLGANATEEEVQTKVQETLELSRKPEPKKDDEKNEPNEELKLARQQIDNAHAEAVSVRMKNVVETGNLSVAKANKLQELLCGAEGSRNTLLLSRTEETESIANQVINILAEKEEQKTPKPGAKTAPQTGQGVELSRNGEGGEEDKGKHGQDLTNEMVSMIPGQN